MNLKLTEEERAFRDELRTFFTTEIPADVRSKVAAGKPLGRDDFIATQRILHARGLAVPNWPVEWGGQEWTPMQRNIWLSEMQLASVPEPLPFNASMIGPVIAQFGSQDMKERFLPKTANLDIWWCQGFSEPEAGSDLASLKTRAVRDGDDYVLTGVKQFISGAGTSDVYVVMARTGDTGARGISAFIVPKDTPGLSFGANEKKMGWNAQPTRQVILDGVRVPAANLLGTEGGGFRIAMHGLNGGRLNIAACSVGGGQAALDRTVAYLAERKAFGDRLLDSQALQFRLADMRTELEAARTLLWRAADALDTGAPDVVELCAMAKRFATDAGFEVANDALQLHGGYGYLAEYGIEKIVRDLRVHQILEGTNEIMRVVVARSVVAAAQNGAQ